MDIVKAEFVMSNSTVAKCPAPNRHEYAFIGRSNVGKSSLINMLTNNKKLAKTAARPGKTQLINHFLINDSWYMVDLPGYGYARTSEGLRRQFEKMICDYILKRENLICLFVLVDSRHEPQKIDLEFMEWLGENGVPFVMVFTKADKLTTTQRLNCIDNYHRAMLDTWESTPLAFMTSAEKRLGREELLDYIDELNHTVKLEQ
ncbi:MAG: ribosome biogenesis GTP-binding protein YihA/YsxC [Odoribacter sp.]|nr:ribosome biogenesis GTP-binding protein YihA/YsxC [Odoribacter sp.]MDY3034574.1 ribosome biogenesis GTP-binding protein YihA/YsxC [Odoribacter sp.]